MTIEFTPRHRTWTKSPDEIRRLIGPACADWSEDRLYALDRLLTSVAQIALRSASKSRTARTCQAPTIHGLN